MKYRDFNQVVNPNDEACYVAIRPSYPAKRMKFRGIISLAKTEPLLQIGWVIPKGFYVLNTKEEEIVSVFQQYSEDVFVIKKKNEGIFIIGRGEFDRKTRNNLLACGINADTIVHNKSGETLILPFAPPGNIAPELKDITLEYSSGTIGDMPFWLTPLRRISSDIEDGFNLPILNNSKILLVNALQKVRKFPLEQQKQIAKIINENFATTPVGVVDMNEILNVSEDALAKEFFEKNVFLHNRMGDYLIDTCNIKRDRVSGELFYFNEKQKIYSNDTGYILGYMTKLVPTLKNHQKEEVIKYLNAYLYDSSVDFNVEPFRIVFKNGVLSLDDMILRPHSPKYLDSIKIHANYNPNASSSTVDEFFHTATKGDKEIEELLYEVIGYTMLKTNELQKAFMLVGSGRNGKSTYFDIIEYILGKENTTSISFKDLSNNFRASALSNKLASLARDISAQPITDSDLVKSISSGESIMIEEKYKAAQSKALFSTLLFAANKIPNTPDTSDGFYRRWTIVPFVADLSSVSRVKGMQFKKKLLEQESLDYVAYKALKAIYRVLSTTEEFTQPAPVERMMKKYKVDNSSILSWYYENVNDLKKLGNMTAKAAYSQYQAWCQQAGRNKFSITNFTRAVETDLGVAFRSV